jgi:hypothetical protein
MPRIVADRTAEEPEKGVPPSRLTFGAREDSDATDVTARSLSAVEVNAEMAIGTSCTFSARFWAVTTISSMPPPASSCGGASCAQTGAAVRATIANVELDSMRFMIPPPGHSRILEPPKGGKRRAARTIAQKVPTFAQERALSASGDSDSD